MKKCNSKCVPICGFCSKYDINNGICLVHNKHREKYNDCNCRKFSCFTLQKNYNKDKYINIDYIKKVFEGEII